ncbi:fumarylacetoacetate hydrolase family protein [Nocardioides sp. zg-1228]|uniref:fumarylacetoacetate hydrolase family protein n=1 Tax=Nocardioides sp. zg-1228 TaxID=2763008 RepID=UPI001642C351|nr:fumarylacetoacetate hydrolase family protein [Nocardioides sp. zg-1228]MBC2935152.1 fumarylacetoacetate hydrolase family protein [Nocardioides sp. zg-1228]QSF56977.1 fumarylacetoacetate hydrolase family protein [Nocardioides sp. zg-1228]
MHLIRYAERATWRERVGVLVDDDVLPLPDVSGFAELLRRPVAEIQSLVTRPPAGEACSRDDVLLLPPVDGRMEVWAAGVTYERSMDARIEETTASQDVYARVYDAERPELFFKAPGWRTVTDGEPIGVRPDAALTVPEPELAMLVTAGGEILGYTICDDVSSRDIEGDNPLYLPQAKMYDGSCAIGALVRPAWEVPDAHALGIRLVVRRDGRTLLDERTSTARMHRRLDDLVLHLGRALALPDGAVLATGTGIVPDLDFTLRPGDLVEITIDEIGTLSNPTAPSSTIQWLSSAADDPSRREALSRTGRGGDDASRMH